MTKILSPMDRINDHNNKILNLKLVVLSVTLLASLFYNNVAFSQTSLSKVFDETGVHYFEIPSDGIEYKVRITVVGADGGNQARSKNIETYYKGGTGAAITALFDVAAGDVLNSIVGIAGRSGEPMVKGSAGGGGGGSGVTLNGSELLIVAGGGGGASKDAAGLPGLKMQNKGNAGKAGIAGGGGSFKNAGGEKYIDGFGGGGGKITLTALAFGGMGAGIGGGGGGAGLGGGGGAGGGKIGYAGGGGGGYTGGTGATNAQFGGEGGSSYVSTKGERVKKKCFNGKKNGVTNQPFNGKVIIELYPKEATLTDNNEMLGLAYQHADIFEDINFKKSTEAQYKGLFIGIDNYPKKWESLTNSKYDATTLATLLKKKYGFDDITMVFDEDATRARVINYLTKFMESASPNDNLVIFYSGHGVEVDGVGYWVPVSAKDNLTSELISNAEVESILSKTEAKHVLAMVDASFNTLSLKASETVSRSQFTDEYFEQVDDLISRQAITSGGARPTNREELKHSVFVKYLLKFLEKNQKQQLDCQSLFDMIMMPVFANSPNKPEIGTIKDAGHEGGQFIFKKEDVGSDK